MKYFPVKSALVFLATSFVITAISGQESTVKPVTPNASPEAVALLNYFYSISGKYILTGQHNYPDTKDRNTIFAQKFIGKTPVIFSTDFGFAGEGDKDSYLARPEIIREAVRQHKKGAIVTICWHAVPPTGDEPTTFQPLPGAVPDSLASVQGQLTDRQFRDVLTPGTVLHERWCKQVDTIARYLKQLQDADVPILWRPYHEMNGNWFWWGSRHGQYGTAALYRQLFDRLVNFHKLNNLVWIWSVDRPHSEEMKFEHFFPGSEYLDILALDVYGNEFRQDYYNALSALSEGKPMVLGEVGNPPSPEVIEDQPKWAYYVLWAGMVRNITREQYAVLTDDGHYLFQEDRGYIESMAEYRKAFNLDVPGHTPETTKNLSGNWIFNENKSMLNGTGASNLPFQISVIQKQNSIELLKSYLLEYTDNRVDTLKLSLDGKALITEFWDSPMKTIATWISTDTLEIKSTATLTRGERTMEMVIREKWYLTGKGETLVIEQYSSSFWGERTITMVFDRIGF